MNIPQAEHIEFYSWQIKVLEEEWKRYASTQMKILIDEKRLFVGRVWGIQEKQGNVVLRFKSESVPRMKQPYFLNLVGPEAPAQSVNWDFSYLEFRLTEGLHMHDEQTEITTINYLKSEEAQWSYILVSGFDSKLLNDIREKHLDRGNHPLIVVAETDPPVEYLRNLLGFVKKNESDSILNLDVSVTESLWQPKNLDNEKEITQDVIKFIEERSTNVIQGPPGTGKSYLAAKLCEHYLAKGKSICVTALTNKALTEIAAQPGLAAPISHGKVFKTNLSSNELRDLPGLKSIDSFSPMQGELVLSTYYKLSQKYTEIIEQSKRFDLLIIEEASQAYLATIAMFNSIAQKVLIIGDHKQLTPVVLKREEAKNIHPLIDGIIDGLQTCAFNNSSISYRLTKTRRLTSNAAGLTGLYYNNSLKSISELEGDTSFISAYNTLFHSNGGISIAKLPSAQVEFSEQDIYRFICNVAMDILSQNPKLEVALLCPYIKVESALYSQYSKISNDYTRITINTVHKIQGLTADLTILYLPLTGQLDLDDNLFNVATSRAKRGTLIVTYQHINLKSSISRVTLRFINDCQDVSNEFMEVLGKDNLKQNLVN